MAPVGQFAPIIVGACAAWLALTGCGFAADPAPTGTSQLRGAGLQVVDWAIIAIYAVSTILLGWYYGRQQTDTQEYFVGSGDMNPLLIGVSLFATLLSTISYLSQPGEALGKGPVYMATLLALPLVYLVVAFVLLPVYMRHRVTSAYELLEERLGLVVRLLGAVMFVLLRLVWMSLLVYLAAKAMTVMLGISQTDARFWIPWIVAITGSVAVVYTSLGGLRAVVITDLMQTVLLFGGALLVLATITIDVGGFSWFPVQWNKNWDTQPLLPHDIKTRVTMLGSVLSMFTWYVCTAGGDQTSVQRFMATRDAKAARRAYATQLCVNAVVGVTLGLVGFALLRYYQINPGALPESMNLKDGADKIFPHFIAFQLPVGVSGLVVAAMFAAAMSSIDSGVNSITAVVMTDFLDRFGKRPTTERGHVLAAKLLALGIGAVVVFGSTFVEYVPGNITAVTNKTTNLLVTPIFALFFFALFVPFATTGGVLVGALFGSVTAFVLAFSGPLVVVLQRQFGINASYFGTHVQEHVDKVTNVTSYTAQDPVSFQWVGPVALAVNLVTGVLVSLLYLYLRRGTKRAA